MKIVVLDAYAANPGDIPWDEVRALGELVLYDRTAVADTAAHIGDADMVLSNKAPISGEVIRSCPNLKFIGILGTGYNHIDLAAATERNIPVCNVPGYSTNAVTQLAIGFILEVAEHIGEHSRACLEGQWQNCPDFVFWNYPLFEVAGKTLGIVGYGTIGHRVAVAASALGMEVLAYSRHRPSEPDGPARIVDLETLFATSDFISLHCPLNADSENLICASTIDKMKPGAVVINTARGGCISETDVASALATGKLGWYCADVVSREPIAADNPLLTAPHVLLTPHIGWAPYETRVRLMEATVGNIEAFLRGEPEHVVNPL